MERGLLRANRMKSRTRDTLPSAMAKQRGNLTGPGLGCMRDSAFQSVRNLISLAEHKRSVLKQFILTSKALLSSSHHSKIS